MEQERKKASMMMSRCLLGPKVKSMPLMKIVTDEDKVYRRI